MFFPPPPKPPPPDPEELKAKSGYTQDQMNRLVDQASRHMNWGQNDEGYKKKLTDLMKMDFSAKNIEYLEGIVRGHEASMRHKEELSKKHDQFMANSKGDFTLERQPHPHSYRVRH